MTSGCCFLCQQGPLTRFLTTSIFFNTFRPRQNGRYFADDIFKCIFLNENVWISIKISLKFVPKGPINNIPALVQIMAWRRPGDKPLSEAMMVHLPTHIWVSRPQWVNLGFLICSRYDTEINPHCWPLVGESLTREWILSNFITHFIIRVLTYRTLIKAKPCFLKGPVYQPIHQKNSKIPFWPTRISTCIFPVSLFYIDIFIFIC